MLTREQIINDFQSVGLGDIQNMDEDDLYDFESYIQAILKEGIDYKKILGIK